MIHSRDRNKAFREWRKKQAYRILPLFPPFGSLFIRGIGATLRARFTGHPGAQEMVKSGIPFVLVFFHGRQFLLVHQLQGWPAAIMTSISYMGEIQARILNRFGFVTIKGSRSKGGARVLAEMTRLVRQGRIGAFAVDGPRGPYREVKTGAIYVAAKLKLPLVAVTTSAWPSRVMRSAWDRYLMPLPFSRTVVHFGEPIYLKGDLSETYVQRECHRIGAALEKLENEADALTGRP